jgi:hypothetical protein
VKCKRIATAGFPWLLASALLFVTVRPALAQSYLLGDWMPLYNEDFDERIPGPEQGDYVGLPVTPADVARGHSWDPEELTLPADQCRPHPSIYGFRGITTLRIWADMDPYTQAVTQLETMLVYQVQHRHIWMVKHPAPTATDLSTWQGYSVGHWDGDVLQVHTDHLRESWVRRNGLATDDQATMDESFFVDDDILTHVMMISDPQYLSEPLVKSNEFKRTLWIMGPYPCVPDNEVPRPQGQLPMHLPGDNPMEREWAVRTGVPVSAADGGAATMLPEYQEVIKAAPKNPPLSLIEAQEKRLLNSGQQ